MNIINHHFFKFCRRLWGLCCNGEIEGSIDRGGFHSCRQFGIQFHWLKVNYNLHNTYNLHNLMLISPSEFSVWSPYFARMVGTSRQLRGSVIGSKVITRFRTKSSNSMRRNVVIIYSIFLFITCTNHTFVTL